MNRTANPFNELHAIAGQVPREPFLDRPRRPNGYRNTPEYQEWAAAKAAVENRIVEWY